MLSCHFGYMQQQHFNILMPERLIFAYTTATVHSLAITIRIFRGFSNNGDPLVQSMLIPQTDSRFSIHQLPKEDNTPQPRFPVLTF